MIKGLEELSLGRESWDCLTRNNEGWAIKKTELDAPQWCPMRQTKTEVRGFEFNFRKAFSLRIVKH